MHPIIDSFGRDADYWCQRVDLGDIGSNTQRLVTPKPYFRGPDNINGQPSHVDDNLVVVRGFAYTFAAGAAGGGFQLQAANQRGGATWNLWEDLASGAVNRTAHLNDLNWPLRPASFDGSPTQGDIADILQVVGVGNVSSGTLCVWGIHVRHDAYGPNAKGSPGSGAVYARP